MKIWLARKWKWNICVVLCSFICLSGAAVMAEEEALKAAKIFFESFVEGGENVEPNIVDYFADDAKIIAIRQVGDNEPQRIVTNGRRHKEYLRRAFKRAKIKKLTGKKGSSFSDVFYAMEGECVRISALRHSEFRRTETLYSLLVCQDSQGEWRIMEEINEIKE